MRSVDYLSLEFPVRPPPDEAGAAPFPVVVVGAGPVGLTLALDLAQRGVPVLVLSADTRLRRSARAIAFAKRTLEIWDRLGVGDAVVDNGVPWSCGRVFHGWTEVFRFDLQPEPGHERPAFVNLPQYEVEGLLIERAMQRPEIEIRWGHRVVAVEPGEQQVVLGVQAGPARYEVAAAQVVACDGPRSTLRELLGEQSKGREFRDRFLVADVRVDQDLPLAEAGERWAWFDPPFHRGHCVMLHRQPGNLWRIDFQLGQDADPELEQRSERIVERVRLMLHKGLGHDVAFTLEWAGVYNFASRRMDRFRLGRVLFAGDAAHGVSPFGARGANSGVQDADNLGWKLAAVVRGDAPDALLDSYATERERAADDNIVHSTRASDFIGPQTAVGRLFRGAVLGLARDMPFARPLVNGGRLSEPALLDGSPLNTADGDAFAAAMRPGSAPCDAPLRSEKGPCWLLRQLPPEFTLLVFGPTPRWARLLPLAVVAVDGKRLHDDQSLAARRWDAVDGAAYLLRPDGHVAARWRRPTASAVLAAMSRALARSAPC